MVDFTKLLLDSKLAKVLESGRPMPSDSEGRQAALTILEWAHDSEDAAAVAPDEVRLLRAFWQRPFTSEAHWRLAYDLALDAWKKGYELHQKKQAVF